MQFWQAVARGFGDHLPGAHCVIRYTSLVRARADIASRDGSGRTFSQTVEPWFLAKEPAGQSRQRSCPATSPYSPGRHGTHGTPFGREPAVHGKQGSANSQPRCAGWSTHLAGRARRTGRHSRGWPRHRLGTESPTAGNAETESQFNMLNTLRKREPPTSSPNPCGSVHETLVCGLAASCVTLGQFTPPTTTFARAAPKF